MNWMVFSSCSGSFGCKEREEEGRESERRVEIKKRTKNEGLLITGALLAQVFLNYCRSSFLSWVTSFLLLLLAFVVSLNPVLNLYLPPFLLPHSSSLLSLSYMFRKRVFFTSFIHSFNAIDTAITTNILFFSSSKLFPFHILFPYSSPFALPTFSSRVISMSIDNGRNSLKIKGRKGERERTWRIEGDTTWKKSSPSYSFKWSPFIFPSISMFRCAWIAGKVRWRSRNWSFVPERHHGAITERERKTMKS